MDTIALFAKAFQYPFPGQVNSMFEDTQKMRDMPGGKALTKFVKLLKELSLSEQEELYTRTLDLSPLTAPYVGYHIWGESYKRGEFMANLNSEMKKYEVELDGELPDHLLPILRYLHVCPTPMPELMEVLDQSLNLMKKSLKKSEDDNPYLYLFEALAYSFGAVKVEA